MSEQGKQLRSTDASNSAQCLPPLASWK